MVSTVAAMSLKDRVLAILSMFPIRKIPCLSVVDLGVVRDVTDDRVVITPTYTGCPATIAIERDIRAALDREGLAALGLETTLVPPWTTDWISEDGREKLRAFGIAPPPKGAGRHSLRETPRMPALRLDAHRRNQPLRLHALQIAPSLPRLPRAVRPLQVPLTCRSIRASTN